MESELKKAVYDYLVVDSTDDSNYDDWEDNTRPDSVPLYVNYYFFNYTNVEEFQNNPNVKPILEQVGPYVYRKFKKKINVTFIEDGEQVTMSQWVYYTYEPDLTKGDLNTDRIIGINPGYVGVITAAGSESNLAFGIVPSTLDYILELMIPQFPPLVIEQAFGLMVTPVFQPQLISAIMAADNSSDYETAQAQFLDIWSNAETAPTTPTQWLGFGVLGGSNLSLASAMLLWEQGSPTPNLFNGSTTATQLWYGAKLGDPSARLNLQNIFSLEESDLLKILAWRDAFNTRITTPTVLANYNLTTVDDLAWLQWGTGEVTNYTSIKYLDPSLVTLPGIPEFGVWARDILGQPVGLGNAAAHTLLNGTYGIFDLTNAQTFVYALQTNNEQLLQAYWGLSVPVASAVAGYLQYVSDTFVESTLQTAFAAGGGLWTNRTPQEWLWGVVDPLLHIVNPANEWVYLYLNTTTQEAAEADAYKYMNTYYTGKHDIDKVMQFVKFHNNSVLPANAAPAFWPEDIAVHGTNGEQFRPFLDDSDDLVAFIEELLRPMILIYDEDVTEKDITLQRYRLSPENFVEQPIYNQAIAGFGNMTGYWLGLPLFLSKPMFLDCPEEWRAKLVGMNPGPDHDSFLDVEPITGKPMDVAKRLQINYMFYNTTAPYDKWNVNMPKDVIYPLGFANENAQITDSLADDFKESVYRVILIRIVVFWIGVAGGSVLAALGGVILGFVIWKNSRYRQSVEYKEVVSDDEDEEGNNSSSSTTYGTGNGTGLTKQQNNF